MKKQLLFIMVIAACFSFSRVATDTDVLTGAWLSQAGSAEQVLVFKDGYYTHTTFDKTNKKFIETKGGIYKIKDNGKGMLKTEFNTSNTHETGKEYAFAFAVKNRQLVIDTEGNQTTFAHIDDGTGSLSGVWRITGRMQNGTMASMPRRDRKTLKVLSGTRFQWIAINPATKEFFGTGGGTYTFMNGKYIETIEFFSRDSSRVGASLTFNGSVEGDNWNHKGLSSKGDPINEIWTREKY